MITSLHKSLVIKVVLLDLVFKMSGYIDDILLIYRVSVDPETISSFDNRLFEKSNNIDDLSV